MMMMTHLLHLLCHQPIIHPCRQLTSLENDLPKHEITIPNTHTMFKEKIWVELKFFSGGSSDGNELKVYVMNIS